MEEMLKEHLKYDSSTGEFWWIKQPHPRIKIGTKAGAGLKDRYARIMLKRKNFSAHRVAWLLHYGHWPNGVIDHINGNPYDNRIENLRDVTQSENMRNLKKHRDGKLFGAHFHPRCKQWQSSAHFNGKNYYFGIYRTAEEASKVAKEQIRRFDHVNTIRR